MPSWLMSTRTATSLRAYVLTRLALAIPTVLILLTMVFLLMRVAPGDPIRRRSAGASRQEELEQRREAAGFDKPLLEQYVEYLGDASRSTSGRRSTTTARSPRSSSRTAPPRSS